jgi:hypothetical protein
VAEVTSQMLVVANAEQYKHMLHTAKQCENLSFSRAMFGGRPLSYCQASLAAAAAAEH